VAVDTGGTFTDFVRVRDGAIEVVKEPSTPASPETAILRGLEALGSVSGEIIHGTTVGTNALLERKGARTALVTTAGFEDVIEIGRQARPDLYDIMTVRGLPLVEPRLRIGVVQRTRYDGTSRIRLTKGEVDRVLRMLASLGAESIAVCLLFSFVDPADEQRIGRALAKLGVPVSLSSAILPEYREYERTSTTVINAYLAPVMGRYLARLDSRVPGHDLRVMQSNGGAVRAAAASQSPVRTILSGPAGGVVGAFAIAGSAGYDKLITFDMGGTSTDVALLDGGVSVTRESIIDGMPVGVPMMDMHTVGAGGGSIAQVDGGGALEVGPRSAGADPGPICYGQGTGFTVTDANVILGRLLPRFFLGGRMALETGRIRSVLERQEWTRPWTSTGKIEELAEGVVRVVNNNMEQAIRLISVERGHDVGDFTLVAFGGAGALHAAALAAGMGIPRVLVPRHPGALSALGLLMSDARKDYSRTLLGTDPSESDVSRVFDELHTGGVDELIGEGFRKKDLVVNDFLDVRYHGQSYELTVPYTADWTGAFHDQHRKRYGHANANNPVEVVAARTTLVGKTPKPALGTVRRTTREPEPVESGRVFDGGRWVPAPAFDRSRLGHGHVIDGPAIIGEYSSTTYVPPAFRATVDRFGNLLLEAAKPGARKKRTLRKTSSGAARP
jgi:N-methylhydantoinase A